MNRAIIAIMALLLGGISSAWAYRIIEQAEGAYELTAQSNRWRTRGWVIRR